MCLHENVKQRELVATKGGLVFREEIRKHRDSEKRARRIEEKKILIWEDFYC
jgi:hypothetical protein